MQGLGITWGEYQEVNSDGFVQHIPSATKLEDLRSHINAIRRDRDELQKSIKMKEARIEILQCLLDGYEAARDKMAESAA